MSCKIKIVTIIVLMILIFIQTPFVFAEDDSNTTGPISSWYTSSGDVKIEKVTSAANKVWNTTLVIVRVAAFSLIIFAGIRYMYASSSDKADIKKSMSFLIIGASLVFGASIVVDIIYKIANQIL